MKKFGTKQLIPLAMALMGIVFCVDWFTQLGFWEKNQRQDFSLPLLQLLW